MYRSYRKIEKDYYKTLAYIVNSLDIKSDSSSRLKLPYILEKATLFKLRPGRRWVISAISGSGKTTASGLLAKQGFKKLPNVTTRPKRFGEKKGENVFISKKLFLSWKKRNFLFNPHKRNGVLHAIFKKDLKKISNKNSMVYLDKSVASALLIKKNFPAGLDFVFLYILVPTFKELYKRILKRETKRKNEKHLSKKEIFDRFEEEISDMKKSTKLPYIYIVNDSIKRMHKLLSKTVVSSVNRWKLAKK